MHTSDITRAHIESEIGQWNVELGKSSKHFSWRVDIGWATYGLVNSGCISQGMPQPLFVYISIATSVYETKRLLPPRTVCFGEVSLANSK
uniref:Uncharacterized protein n=1 Tax=Solanum lycopersicum TaxID=4081 RepID=A0A3Q7I2H4_SOLLC